MKYSPSLFVLNLRSFLIKIIIIPQIRECLDLELQGDFGENFGEGLEAAIGSSWTAKGKALLRYYFSCYDYDDDIGFINDRYRSYEWLIPLFWVIDVALMNLQ